MAKIGMDALRECLGVCFEGNHSALARAIDLKPQTVNEVLRSGKRVPAGWCVPLERATEGRFTRSQFRPDLYPDDESAAAQNEAAA